MSASNASNLSREDAIARLTACQPLSERLAAEGWHLTMDQDEQAVLQGFKQVWLAGYLDGSSHIFRQAGLKRSDLAALHRLLGRSQDEHMRQQYQDGND